MSLLTKPLLLGVLTAVVGIGAGILPFGPDFEESSGLDLLHRLRGARPAPRDVLIVSVDDESADRLRLPSEPRKWPRSLHAGLVERLAKGGASVVVFDLFFEEPRIPEEDRLFADSVRKAGNVVLCERLKDEFIPVTAAGERSRGGLNVARVIPALPPLAQAAAGVTPYPLPKVPVKVSGDWTFKAGAGELPTLPVVALHVHSLPVYGDFLRVLAMVRPDLAGRLPRAAEARLSGSGAEGVVREIREIFEADPSLGGKMREELQRSDLSADGGKRQGMLRALIAMYEGGNRKFLNFYGPPRTVATVPYHRMMPPKDGAAGDPLLPDVRGKAVFVGASEISQLDQRDGFHTVFTQPDGLDISGVEIAATSFANLLEDAPIRPLDARARIAVLFLWGLAVGVLCRLLPPLPAAVSAAVLGALYLAVAKYRFAAAGAWYPVAIPLFLQMPSAFVGAVIWRYVDTNRERRNIRKAFGYYLPDQVVDQLAGNIAELKAEQQPVHGICLNTDAEQYTALAESLEPAELARLMNRYYEAIFRPVKEHGGIVSNVIGDSMMAVWVAAAPDPALREKACRAALDIASAIEEFNRSPGVPPLPTRIGLHSGPLMFGNIGAVDHYEYRPVGDIVNTAVRLEGLNKYLGTRILVSGEAIHQLDGFVTREIGRFRFVGKTLPLVVWELIGNGGAPRRQVAAACEAFAAGLDAFRRGAWPEAAGKFGEAVDLFGEDGPSHFYLELCARYRRNPPAGPWDGVVYMDRK